MPRLDPAHPPVWRAASTLQFGTPARVVIDDPSPWQEALIVRLADGLTPDDLRRFAIERGLSTARVRGFVDRLAPVLSDAPRPGDRVTLLVSPGMWAEAAAAVTGLLSRVARVEVDGTPRRGTPVVVLAHYEVDPRVSAQLMRDDIPHLPALLRPDRADVGPWVVPGETPCLRCLAAHRRDQDPAWPMIAAQLLTAPCPPIDPVLIADTALLVAQLVTCDDAPTDRIALLRPGSARRTWHVPAAHPECGCRSPGGNATAAAANDRAPEPTTATAYARPA
ncbi:hypothetical protein QE381_000331 [Microbacterium sp. SORGH_AS 888]|nr:hypothetical protein [Microbacterium sp. SORGH_AS_0888]